MSDLTPETLAELKRLESQLPRTTLAMPDCQRPDWDDKGKLGGLVEMRRSGFVPTLTTILLTCAEANYFKSLFDAAPALIAAAEECERLRGLLRETEWKSHTLDYDDTWISQCPCCHGIKPVEYGPDAQLFIDRNYKGRIGHAPDCRLAAAIKGTID